MSNKQLFMLGYSIRELISKIGNSHVQFAVKNPEGVVLMANELQAEFYGIDSVSTFIGQSIYDLLPGSEVKIVAANDAKVLHSEEPQLFYETCLNNECLSIKSRVLNSRNHTVGVGVIDFYFKQIALKDIIALTNDLIFNATSNNKLMRRYVMETRSLNNLSHRERECVRYLAAGMTYKQIANILNISPRTVETHIVNIKDKLGCLRRSDILSKVIEIN